MRIDGHGTVSDHS
jgi:hypothetical protein